MLISDLQITHALRRAAGVAAGLSVCLGMAGCQQIVDRLQAAVAQSTPIAPQPEPQAKADTQPQPQSAQSPVLAQPAPFGQQGQKVQQAPQAEEGQAAQKAQQGKQLPSAPKLQEPPAAKPAGVTPPARVAQPTKASSLSQLSATFQECDSCPVMVKLPAGTFLMGSPGHEAGRDSDEAPRIQVAVAGFAIGRTEVTRSQWMAFERESGHRADSGCLTWDGDGYVLAAHLGWKNPGFAQTEDHPVVCVNASDAQAFAQWVSRKTGQIYRLPREHEWEYAARSGAQSAYAWASGPAGVCGHANGADAALLQKNPRWPGQSCQDGFAHTAPVGSFVPNAWGVYDMHGNVMEWTQDCWSAQLVQPAAGLAPLNCGRLVTRGGGWDLPVSFLRSAYRGKAPARNRGTGIGFRLARE
jgi:formylglycine-generating enzyme required for sulfatase activity